REPITRRSVIERIDDKRVVLLGDDDAGNVILAAISFHLSRLRGRSHRIERCDAGGGNSLHTNSRTCGDTPTPALPRKRERERSARMVGDNFNPRVVALRARTLDAVDGQAWQPETENPSLR